MKHQLFAYTGKFVPQYDIGAQNATKLSEYERFTNFGGGACTLQVAKTYYLLTEDSRDYIVRVLCESHVATLGAGMAPANGVGT